MKENKITIIINNSIEKVFAFTTNPKNTQSWIPSIVQETSTEYPPQIGTQYKNRGEKDEWEYYKVVAFVKNKIFTLSDLKNNYFVKYTYKKLSDKTTEMEYFEWVENGELEKPFTREILQQLKDILS